MKKSVRIVALLAVLALSVGVAVRAADNAKVAGTWEMTMEGRQGTVTNTLTIEQDGDKIKGTMKTQRGETPFEGTIKGKEISFTITRQTPNGEVKQEFSGTVDGDSIKGKVKSPRGESDWTAKKK